MVKPKKINVKYELNFIEVYLNFKLRVKID